MASHAATDLASMRGFAVCPLGFDGAVIIKVRVPVQEASSPKVIIRTVPSQKRLNLRNFIKGLLYISF